MNYVDIISINKKPAALPADKPEFFGSKLIFLMIIMF